MDRFLTIFAWIMAIPSTLYVLWFLLVLAVALTHKGATLTIGGKSIIGWIMAAACWAWILR